MFRAGLTIRHVVLLVALALVGGHAGSADARALRAAVTVPNVVGMHWQAAQRDLRAAGLRVVLSAVRVQGSRGTVVAERPRARSVVPRGTIVRLSVANPAPVRVPDVVGRLRDAAQERLRTAGLAPRVVYVHSLLEVGSVVAQAPAAGVEVVLGTDVRISISSGPGP